MRLSLTGGLVGAAINNSSNQSLNLNSKIFLTVAIFAVSGYAIVWLKYQGRELKCSLQALKEIEQEIGLRDFWDKKQAKEPWISYELVLSVLAVMAAILLWL
jgi:hypothetical protein